MRKWLQRLDPRLHLTSAIGWVVMVVVTLAAGVAAWLAAAQVEARARADAEGLLAEYATQVRDAVSMNLEMRSQLLQVVAVQISATAGQSPLEQLQALQAVRDRFSEFASLSLSDAQGLVLAAAGGWPEGPPLVSQAWFDQARRRSVVSDVHAQPDAARRELILAAPLGAEEVLRGNSLLERARAEAGGSVLVASLPWAWVEARVAHMQQLLAQTRPLELMLASRDGRVLIGPAHWLGRSIEALDSDLGEEGAYVVSLRTRLRLADSLGLGWTVVVREPAAVTLAPVQRTRQAVFLTVFVAGLLSALLAVAAARAVTRRLQDLAQAAARVREGQQEDLTALRGRDEVAEIGRTLGELVDHLQQEKRALRSLNTELDRRVAERTARIERMADEARLAAVSRERLRLARDLHDTLAHSLMALLTQIRLVRKLRSRLSDSELDAELQTAEEVATTGLAEARAAIAQMRDNSVREAGLAAAVQELARRFAERSGLALQLEIHPQAGGWSDERFEAVFRIVEEALRNVERHAQAREVRLTLQLRQEGQGEEARALACVEVCDDGCGFDPLQPRPGHYGLRGMQEQAALVGARLSLDSREGQGTRLRLELEV